jgi:uncharacterized protein YaiL (DUF2058 family)
MSKKKKPLGSLRDQLKEAGLVTAKQVRKAEKGALRSDLRIKKGIDVDEAKEEVEAARLKKLDEDRQKNERLNVRKVMLLIISTIRPRSRKFIFLKKTKCS